MKEDGSCPATAKSHMLMPSVRVCSALLLLAIGLATPVAAQVVDPILCGTDGPVRAIARSGNVVYIGGSFSTVRPITGGGVPLSGMTGLPLESFAKVAGSVHAAVPDGHGGWFIGGQFSGVGGLPRINLAHVLEDGSVAPWNPGSESDRFDYVSALALQGTVLYVGGSFRQMGGHPRPFLAAVDAVTGTTTSWNPNPNGIVTALALKGNSLYVGGTFNQIGGQRRVLIAALDTRTATATDWDPHANDVVLALAVEGPIVYAAGHFTEIGGQGRNRIAALDVRTGAATSWNPDPAGNVVFHLASSGNTVYACGSFSRIGGQPRKNVAALDARTGAATPWIPGPPFQEVDAVTVRGGTVFAGGPLQDTTGEPRYAVAALDASTGAVSSWLTRVSGGGVRVLAVSGNVVYAGGTYGSVGDGHRRSHLAALDATTGAVTPWNPEPDGSGIFALATWDGVVYAAGDFTTIGRQARTGLAGLEPLTGSATPLVLNPDGPVHTLAAGDHAIYVGGNFASIAGLPRRHLAAVDPGAGAVTAWNPGANGPIATLVVDRNLVYAGGAFDRIGDDGPAGQARRHLAALDAKTGAVTAWDPNVSDLHTPIGTYPGQINALAVSEGTVYAGGSFDSIGGQHRGGLAALDAGTGMATPWHPTPSFATYTGLNIAALAAMGTTVYVGGQFNFIAGERHYGFAAVDAVTGAPTGWRPDGDGPVVALARSGKTLYVGGSFTKMGGFPAANVAAVVTGPAIATSDGVTHRQEASEIPALVLDFPEPNPARATTRIRFTLPAPASVSLAVFDVLGRRIVTVLDHAPYGGGGHEVNLRTDGWRAGIYFCRLQTPNAVVTRKLLVVK